MDESNARRIAWTLVGLGSLAIVATGWLQSDTIGGGIPGEFHFFLMTVLGLAGGPLLTGGVLGLVVLAVKRP